VLKIRMRTCLKFTAAMGSLVCVQKVIRESHYHTKLIGATGMLRAASRQELAGATGLEPVASCVTCRRFNRLIRPYAGK
jgi:hypothetical protein